MDKSYFLGIDTSNYTTSAAVCDFDGNVIANIKIPLNVDEGKRGLRQSDALFSHTKNLPEISKKLKEVISGKKISAVGYSAYPRDAENSYMPCFLAGEAAASMIAAVLDVPIYKFSHQSGHIMAAVYSSGASDFLNGEFAAFHVSGGTTEIVLVTPNEESFSVKLIGETSDLNAGQAIDRTGVMLGIKFPCGPAMEKLALQNQKKIPKPKISVSGLNCNLSGLENLAQKLYSETNDEKLVCAYVFEFISETLVKMTENLISQYAPENLLYAGGVMSNSIIKSALSKKFKCSFAVPEFSSDNAAGISLLCRKKYLSERRKAEYNE